MHQFIHHPDANIVIQGSIFPMEFWQIIEPEYTLPEGYIGRLFTPGQVHHLIRDGNADHDPANKNDATLAGYVARKAEYEAAYAAQQTGAHIENINGNIVITGPPSMSANKAQIENDGNDSVVLTCDLGDPDADDEIRWSVTAPDGTVVEAADNAIDGMGTWELTTSHEGGHTVRVETDRFGWAEIGFEGV